MFSNSTNSFSFGEFSPSQCHTICYRKSIKSDSIKNDSYYYIDYDSIVRDLDLTKCRVIINNKIYEIKSIDDPMELHDHLEITLSYLGLNNVK